MNRMVWMSVDVRSQRCDDEKQMVLTIFSSDSVTYNLRFELTKRTEFDRLRGKGRSRQRERDDDGMLIDGLETFRPLDRWSR